MTLAKPRPRIPVDDLIEPLLAAIRHRLRSARKDAAKDDGCGELRPVDTIRLCELDLAVVGMLIEARAVPSQAGRARGRLAAYSQVAVTMAAAYGITTDA